nr:hypothetical protein StreXyl84_65230 [Streptomyces sp. Xyl84]
MLDGDANWASQAHERMESPARADIQRLLGPYPHHRPHKYKFREFGIKSFYCRPGIEGAHEKGGIEGQIGYFRRSHFVPVSEVSSLAELNEMVEQWDRQDDTRRIGSRPETVAEYFALEQPLPMPLPEEPFETDRLFTPRVDRYGQIPVRTGGPSVLLFHLVAPLERLLFL